MANNMQIDLTDVFAGLDKLGDEAAESIARSMAVAAGRVFREEAKRLAPEHTGVFNPTSKGAQRPGELRDNIILVRNKQLTRGKQYAYSVTWNRRKGYWWAASVEFGYWQPYKIKQLPDGSWQVVKLKDGTKVKNPKGAVHIGATPFLGPAFDAALMDAREAMLDEGRRVVAELLGGGK